MNTGFSGIMASQAAQLAKMQAQRGPDVVFTPSSVTQAFQIPLLPLPTIEEAREKHPVLVPEGAIVVHPGFLLPFAESIDPHLAVLAYSFKALPPFDYTQTQVFVKHLVTGKTHLSGYDLVAKYPQVARIEWGLLAEAEG